MVKRITRTITCYEYSFGRVDVENGTVEIIDTVTTVDPIGKRQMSAYCDEHDVVLCKSRKYDRKFEIPQSVFVELCMKYETENN